MPGRQEDRIVGLGPIARYAGELQELKQRGGRTLNQMSAAAHCSAALLSRAAKGRVLPSEDHVRLYLTGCGVDDSEEIAGWLAKRQDAAEAALRLRPDLEACRTTDDVADELAKLAHDVIRLDGGGDVAAQLAARLAKEAAQSKPYPGIRPLAIDEVRRLLTDRPTLLTPPTLTNLVFACGGTTDDIAYWQEGWAGLPEAEQAPVSAPPVARGWARRRLLAGALGGVAIVGLSSGAAFWFSRDVKDPGEARNGPEAPSGETLLGTGSPSTRDALLRLAGQVRTTPERSAVGRYVHTHVKVWSRDTTAGDPHDVVTYDEEFLWWDATRHGQRRVVSTVAGQLPVRRDIPLRGDLSLVIDSPSTAWMVLREQLGRQHPPFLGASGRLRTIADLNKVHRLDRAHRAAVLEVLAYSEGLEYDGLLPDPLGRYGIAVSAVFELDGARQQDRLLFDERTGALLCHTQSILGDVPMMTQQTLYMAQTRTDQLG